MGLKSHIGENCPAVISIPQNDATLFDLDFRSNFSPVVAGSVQKPEVCKNAPEMTHDKGG
jgi:hypothetical protein